MSIHSVRRSQCHLAWDNSIPPVLRVQSGDTISFDCLDSSNGQITPNSKASDIPLLDLSKLDQVNGPIYIEGAQPGDTLQVDVLDVDTADWGWTALLPGFGLLQDEFPGTVLKIWKLNKEEGFAYLDDEERIKVPLNPFCGEMGVAPAAKGPHSTIPPMNTGGNIDTKHLRAGATLYLPVEVEGALFSIGDGHAAQGDGEVSGCALETPVKVKIRLTVRKDRSYTKTPHFLSPPLKRENGEYYCTTGVEPDLLEASRVAVREMIKFLVATHDITRVQAYMLCSIVGDLRIHEAVDMPNYVVGLTIPRHVLLNV